MAQSINLDAIKNLYTVLIKDNTLMIPHFRVTSILDISPQKLKDAGIELILMDKDNTMTTPYDTNIYTPFQHRIDEFKEFFGDNFIIISNSAGTKDDKDFRDAIIIEEATGIEVLRHHIKKPNGGHDIIVERGFHKENSVIIGDRVFTDIVFGNKAGMLTILTEQITTKNDNFAAFISKKIEQYLLSKVTKKRLNAPYHPLEQKDIFQ